MFLQAAIDYATTHHAGQYRKTGEPYIDHPLRVMSILKRYDLDEEILMAAVLHDVNEDTDSTNPELERVFGGRVAMMVYALSKNRKPDTVPKDDSTNSKPKDVRMGFYLLRLEHIEKQDPGVIFIKMADQIDNFNSLDVFSPEKQARKIKEIEEDFMPLYKRVAVTFDSVLYKKYKRLLA